LGELSLVLPTTTIRERREYNLRKVPTNSPCSPTGDIISVNFTS
jgi:hypothetical protein